MGNIILKIVQIHRHLPHPIHGAAILILQAAIPRGGSSAAARRRRVRRCLRPGGAPCRRGRRGSWGPAARRPRGETWGRSPRGQDGEDPRKKVIYSAETWISHDLTSINMDLT